MRNIIKIAIFFSVLAFVLSANTQAEGETAPLDPAWQSRYQAAEWVATVRVESINSLVNPSLSAEAGLIAIQGYSYALSVLQQWKAGSKESSTKLRIDLSDCPILLTIDNDYLVFARRNYRGQLQLQSCEQVVHAAEAAPVISWLQTLESTPNKAAAINP